MPLSTLRTFCPPRHANCDSPSVPRQPHPRPKRKIQVLTSTLRLTSTNIQFIHSQARWSSLPEKTATFGLSLITRKSTKLTALDRSPIKVSINVLTLRAKGPKISLFELVSLFHQPMFYEDIIPLTIFCKPDDLYGLPCHNKDAPPSVGL